MNRLYQNIFSTVGVCLLLGACTKEIPDMAMKNVSDGSEVTFGAFGVDTRTTVTDGPAVLTTDWTEEDSVGIFAEAIPQDGYALELGANFRYDAVPGTIASKCDFLAHDASRNLKWRYACSHTFYAYYPFKGAENGMTAAKVPMSLATDQMQEMAGSTAHLGKYSFMKANPVSRVAGDESKVSLSFYNVFSVVELKIKLAPGMQDVSISDLSLSSETRNLTCVEGNIDLTSSIEEECETIPFNVTEGIGSVCMTFKENPVLSSAEETSIFLTVLPGMHDAGSLTLVLTTAGGIKASTVIEDAVTFKSNKCHTRSVVLRSDDFEIPEEVREITVTSAIDTDYKIVPMATGMIYTSRDYTIKNIPTQFAGWQMATSPHNVRLGGMIHAGTAGKVYIISRFNRIAAMQKAGWTNETPLPSSDTDVQSLYEDTSTPTALIVWSKLAGAGEYIPVPPLIDSYFGGLTIIAPVITSAERSEDAQWIEVHSSTEAEYVPKMLATDPIYTDRTQTVQGIPSKYADWMMATTGTKVKLAGTITTPVPGKVYLLTRFNRIAAMQNAGWTNVTELITGEFDVKSFYETTAKPTGLILWSYDAAANVPVAIPGNTTDASFGGFVPIAPYITVPVEK